LYDKSSDIVMDFYEYAIGASEQGLKSKTRREVRKVKSDPPNLQQNEAQKAPFKLEIGRKQQAHGKKPKRNRKGRYKVAGS